MNMSEIGVDVTMPAEQPLTKELAATEFAQAAHDWTGKNWYGFGFDIGHIDDWQICLRKSSEAETGRTAASRSAGTLRSSAARATSEETM